MAILDDDTTMKSRLAVAYSTALRAGHGGANVSIAMAKDVHDWLREQAAGAIDPVPLAGATIWGFPITLEEKWADGMLAVRTTEFIL